MRYLGFLIFSLTLLFSSCGIGNSNKTLDIKDYQEWYSQNKSEFLHEKTIGNYSINVEFVPPHAYALSDFRDLQKVDVKKLKERDSLVNGYLPCRIKFNNKNPQKYFLHPEDLDPNEYSSRLNYYLSHAQKDIYLIDGKDTLHSLLYHFENTYGLEKGNKAIVMFKMPGNNGADLTFVYKDQVLGIGTINFIQNKELILNEPKIKL